MWQSKDNPLCSHFLKTIIKLPTMCQTLCHLLEISKKGSLDSGCLMRVTGKSVSYYNTKMG